VQNLKEAAAKRKKSEQDRVRRLNRTEEDRKRQARKHAERDLLRRQNKKEKSRKGLAQIR